MAKVGSESGTFEPPLVLDRFIRWSRNHELNMNTVNTSDEHYHYAIATEAHPGRSERQTIYLGWARRYDRDSNAGDKSSEDLLISTSHSMAGTG